MTLDDEVLDIYRRSREYYLLGDIPGAMGLYRRNRATHGVDLFYEVELPERLRFIHPMGTVLGRAEYRGALAVYQNVGVGSTLDGARPVIGDGVVLYPGAKVLGSAILGDNVFVTANTVVQGRHIPNNSIVVGDRIMSTTRKMMEHYFP